MDLAKIPVFMLNKIRTSIFTLDDIKLYINGLVSSIGCQDFYKGTFHEEEVGDTFASYDFHTYRIKIFYNTILEEGRIEAIKENQENYILSINILILVSIIHEVVHTFQNYCFHNKDYPFLDILYRQLQYSETCSKTIYDQYYWYFTFERDAETIALENILIILRYLVKDAGLFAYYLEALKSLIMKGYQLRNKVFYSPFESIYQDLFKEECPEIGIDDSYNCLKLGLKVSKNQYNNFKQNYKSIIINKNNLQI